MTAHEVMQPAQFFHGTAAVLSPGDYIETGRPTMTSRAQNRVLQNARGGRSVYTHATDDLMIATSYAQRAVSVARNRNKDTNAAPRVYTVEFTDAHEIDPDAGVIKGRPAGYRSKSPLRVTGIAEPKYDHG